MKFTCEKALLQSAISISSRAVSPKSSITALEGILVNATDELRLTGYNLSTGIRTIVPADVTEPGTLIGTFDYTAPEHWKVLEAE